MQKLRWTERGWSRGFSYCSWKFQSGSGVGGDDGEQVEGSGLRLGRHCALGNCGDGANGLRFALTEREFGGAGPNGCAAWPRHAWTWRSYRATELHVMALGPTSGRAGGRTLEGLCGSRDRPADRPTFSGWPMDQRRPRRSGREVASSAGREEAADERGQRPCAWRDARGRSSGPCADPSAGRAGGSGAGRGDLQRAVSHADARPGPQSEHSLFRVRSRTPVPFRGHKFVRRRLGGACQLGGPAFLRGFSRGEPLAIAPSEGFVAVRAGGGARVVPPGILNVSVARKNPVEVWRIAKCRSWSVIVRKRSVQGSRQLLLQRYQKLSLAATKTVTLNTRKAA